jgi:plasmid stabilization system protein ParE
MALDVWRQVIEVLHARFPANFIIRRPGLGGWVIGLFCFAFLWLYRPLGVQPSQSFSYEVTMALYSGVVVLLIWAGITLLKMLRYFSDPSNWSLLKELTAIVYVLLFLGAGVYMAGFFIEDTSTDRWNLPTFLDSLKQAVLIGLLPFAFLLLKNVAYLLPGQRALNSDEEGDATMADPEVRINSSLKKEHLSFRLDDFLYAEAEGNYVAFHMLENKRPVKKLIRNSISNVEWQLADHPDCFRSHRAFIVNLRKVARQHGNASGYRLSLHGTDVQVPVSRQKARDFQVR